MNLDDYLSKQLKEGEGVVRVVRRYAVVMVPSLVGSAFLILVDFFLLTWWFSHRTWGVLGFVLVLAVALFWGIRAYYLWTMNILVITNRRVIDIDQRGFFERNVAEATYDKIQDVRYTIRGLWQTAMTFGSIVLQTAGNNTNLELTNVKNPVELQHLITDLQHQQTAGTPTELKAGDLVAVLDELKARLGEEGVNDFLKKVGERRDE